MIENAFHVFLAFHVFSGLTCVITGAAGAIVPKRHGWHTRIGEVYFWSICVVFVSATGLALIHWPQDAYLLVLGTLAFSLAAFGYTSRKRRRRGWLGYHATGMATSYITLLTAFYVDNGPSLPPIDRLPHLVYWIGPSAVGLPLLLRALVRRGVIHRRGDRSRAEAPVTSSK
jgi:hypothetical protein